jgi:hypothetical protein
MVWSAAFVGRKRGGLVLIGLMTVLLLIGGGVGPILIGVLAGVAGGMIDAPLTWWRERAPHALRRALSALWPWLFAISLISGLLLFVVALILMGVFDFGDSDFYFGIFQFTFVALLLSVIAGAAHDAERAERSAVGVMG